jgi:2-dehydro-3-deoxyphosphogluconate aldolase/(4S)-4-hydroxy-2-oxoglutarate aldolase
VTPADVIAELGRLRCLAVVRAADGDQAAAVVDALVEGGLGAIELTYTIPDATRTVADIRERHPRILLGAGTITAAMQAREAVAAGADFLVSPGATPTVLEGMIDTRAPVIAGFQTPSELMVLRESGVAACKLFPASLGGVEYLTALRGPFPDAAIIPTGGIRPADVNHWITAGALAVGIGGGLVRPFSDDAGRRATVAAARALADALP